MPGWRRLGDGLADEVSKMPASSSTPKGNKVPQGWTLSQHQNTNHEDFCDSKAVIWVANLPKIGGQQKRAEKIDSLIVCWNFLSRRRRWRQDMRSLTRCHPLRGGKGCGRGCLRVTPGADSWSEESHGAQEAEKKS